MRSDKEYLSKAIDEYLGTSNYFFLTNFYRMTVRDILDLRSQLAKLGARFHVVKNTIFEVVCQQRNLPSFENYLKGPTAVIVGGDNPFEVAKAVVKFHQEKEKAEFKAGLLEGRVCSAIEMKAIAKLPGVDVLRAQLLGLLTTHARQLLYVMQLGPQRLLNVLTRYAEQNA